MDLDGELIINFTIQKTVIRLYHINLECISHPMMSDQEAEKHNAKIENSILAISKCSTKDNIDWILQQIGGVNSQILPTKYLRTHDPSLIGGTILNVSYKLDAFMIFKTLLNHGADITLKNQQEKTVVHLVLNELISNNYTVWEGENIKYADLILTHHVKFKIICNPCDDNGISHFHVACASNHIEAVKFFLNNGVSVNHAVNMDSPILPGYTPLHFALRFGNLEVVQILLDYNADVNLKDARGMTVLHVAFRGTQPDLRKSIPQITSATFVVTSLLLSHQKNYFVNPVDPDGLSHFHIACCINNSDVIEKFLKYGADINQPINFVFGAPSVGGSPLHLAVTNMFADYVTLFGQMKTMMILLEYGASVLTQDAYGNTPLHVVAKLDSPDLNILLGLIGAGADVNARNLEGQTALEILLSKRVAQFNLTADEEYFEQFVDSNARDLERERLSRLRLSYKSLLCQIVAAFIEHGYHLNSFNPVTQKGCLGMLSLWCDDIIMKNIISNAIQSHPKMLVDEMGRSLLHNLSSVEPEESITSSKFLFNEIIKAFPELGCDVDGRDNIGRTPLHMAAYFQNHQAAEELLIHGADVNIVDKEGKTAIEYAFKTCNLCNVLCATDFDSNEQVKHDNNQHFIILTRFVDHVAKLRYCKLYVSRRTKEIAGKIRERFRDDVYEVEESFYRELYTLKETTINPLSLPLGKFLSETGAVAEYPCMVEEERKCIDHYCQLWEVRYPLFPETTMLINLQYRKASKRKLMLQEACDSLAGLIGFELPYLCCRCIFRFLSNSALQNLIEADNAEENALSK